ncbi:MAG: MATE family efflux transporter [Clostridia bacterium]|nr:MATE family efflux transporter [Clostridia bacterium]
MSASALKKQGAAIDMCNGPLFGKILIFAIPIFLTGCLQLLFNTADLMVIGRFAGSRSVAAVGATSALCHLITNLFLGVSSGVSVMVATATGAKNDETVRRTVHTALPLSVICGGIVNILFLLFAEPMLHIMGTPDDIIDLAALYIKIYSCGMIPTMIYNFSAGILRAVGDTRRPLMFLSLAGVINVLLNLIFVMFFKMDVAGVALATAVSQTVSAVLAVRELMRRKDACGFHLRKVRLYGEQIKSILKIGVPAGVQSSLFSVSNVIIHSSINSFGSAAVAGNAAANNIDSFIWLSADALQQTTLTFVGQNAGAGKPDRVKRTVKLCILSTVLLVLFLGSAANIFSETLLSLFITDSPAAIKYGKSRLLLVAGFYFMGGVMNVLSGALRSLGHSVKPMLVTLFANCIFRIIWVFWVFKPLRASEYAWEILFSAYPISFVLASIVNLCIFMYVIKKFTRKASSLSSLQNGI